MDRDRRVDLDLEKLFRARAAQLSFIGAALFLLIAPLDFATFPAHAWRFLALRAGVSAGLVLLGALISWSRPGRAAPALVLIGTVSAAGTIEAMILATGGVTSPYTMGMAVLGAVVLGFLPGTLAFATLLGTAILAIFLAPLALLADPLDGSRLFAQGYLLLALLGAAAVIGRVGRAATARAAALARDMGERELALAQQIDLRTSQLRTASDEWRATVDSTGELILLLDEEWNIVKANQAVSTLTGRGFPELIGRCVSEVPLLAALPCDDNLLERMHRTRTRAETELRHRDRDFLVSAEPIPEGRAQAGGAVVIVRDVTERTELIAEITAAANRTRQILERSPFGVLVIDEELRVRFANPGVLAIGGYSREEFVGAKISGFPGCAELGLASWVGEALGGKPFRFGPARFHCKQSERTVIANFTGIPFDEGGRRSVLLFVEDVTELHRAEEARHELAMILQQAQKMDAIGTLASGIAHDFNNVLLAVMGLADAAAERIGREHPAHDDLDAVVAAAERGSDLVNQLLAFGRQQDLKTIPVDVNEVVSETCRMLRPMLPRDLALDLQPAGGLPAVIADPVQIGQVLVNLAVNARDAMPGGGTLTIATGTAKVAEGDAAHPGVLAGEYVTITVRDTGHGIPSEERERIFEPFFTTKETGRGTGLGLSTSYGIVTQHGGALRVESEVGRGSTFLAYLPASDLAAAALQDRAPLAGGGETVLLVDDDERARHVIGRRLQQLGYRVLAARDGAEALRLAGGEIALLACDVILPGDGAREVAAAVRRRAPGCRVLFLSGHPEGLLAERGLLGPGEQFVSKSLGPDGIARRVRECLDRPSPGPPEPTGGDSVP